MWLCLLSNPKGLGSIRSRVEAMRAAGDRGDPVRLILAHCAWFSTEPS